MQHPSIETSSLPVHDQYKFVSRVAVPDGRKCKIVSLVDTGASACFVKRKFVKDHVLKPYKVNNPIFLALADGTVISKLDEAVDLTVTHGSHTSTTMFFIADIKYDLILGMSWMDMHQPISSYGDTRSLHFSSHHCLTNCLKDGIPETIY